MSRFVQLSLLALCLGLALAIAAPVFAAAYGTSNFACDDLSALPVNINAQWQASDGSGVYSILRSNCAGCHTLSGPRRFRVASTADQSLQLLLGEPGLVQPRAARMSELLLRLNCVNPALSSWRMPRCSTPPCSYRPLSDQALVYDWIMQGARGVAFGQVLGDVVFTDGLESERQ